MAEGYGKLFANLWGSKCHGRLYIRASFYRARNLKGGEHRRGGLQAGAKVLARVVRVRFAFPASDRCPTEAKRVCVEGGGSNQSRLRGCKRRGRAHRFSSENRNQFWAIERTANLQGGDLTPRRGNRGGRRRGARRDFSVQKSSAYEEPKGRGG